MRCEKCGHSNPENHKYCGMCGSKLAKVVSSIPIDDNDPLELEAPLYRFEDHSQTAAKEPVQLRERDRQLELVRDASSRNSEPRTRNVAVSSTVVENLPREIVEPEEVNPARSRTITGIGGPSFLGLGYENAGNSGFVYDKPRNDGFIYDTDAESAEYLLEETRRGVSWRAWALLLLLAAGAGLGYIQWRASHHQGPDLATILARSGVTVDPSGPVIPDKSAKPPAQKPSAPADQAAKTDSINASGENASSADSDSSTDADSKNAKSTSSDATSDSKDANAPSPEGNAKGKSGDAKVAAASAASKTESNKSDEGDEAKSASATKDDDESKPESDGPAAKVAKSGHANPDAVEEEPVQPKSLGDKDPRLVLADKYIQGRGVRQNCSAGVNLLREGVSAGNPAASVKLGALYWSGTCVTQSKVTAYQWFSRAHSLEPQNRWVERSRSSLWASMTPQEKRRIAE
jgi:hypothetical protein